MTIIGVILFFGGLLGALALLGFIPRTPSLPLSEANGFRLAMLCGGASIIGLIMIVAGNF
jgi:hypothetical protein